MKSLPNGLTEVISPAAAMWVVVACAAGGYIIAILLAIWALQQSRTIHDLTGDLAKANDRKDGLAEANARLRAARQMPVPPPPRQPMRRPEPPAPPTVAFQAPAPTQQIPQVDRFGGST
jgi:hypothetical protein